MRGAIPAVMAALMLMCAADAARAQHDPKKPSGHDAPAAEKSAGHTDPKPASGAAHAPKPASTAPQRGEAPVPAKATFVSAEAAVDRVMNALDRELGKPKAGTSKASRRAPAPARTSRVEVSWKMQLVWPEAEPPSDPLRVQWPEPVLESLPLRFSYIGLPK